MLIKKETFELILKKQGRKIFYYDYEKQNRHYNFFQVGISEGVYLSEDYGFNKLCYDCDINTYCNFNYNLIHFGEIPYQGNFYNYLKNYIDIYHTSDS